MFELFEITNYINTYLTVEYKLQLLFTSKKLYSLINKYKNDIKNKKNYISLNFDENIIDLMGGIGNMILYPVLPYQKQFNGSTDYLDNISPDYLDNKIMIGIDKFKRSFIVLKLFYNNFCSTSVLFQRYTNITNSWTHASYGSNEVITWASGYFYNKGSLINNNIKKNIDNLLKDRGYIINNNFYENKIENIYLIS